jgi:hypothetical protein
VDPAHTVTTVAVRSHSLEVSLFRRRRSAGPPLEALLDNYLVRAEAIADGGGGNLWVIEPSVPSELLLEFTEAVVLHLTDHGVGVDDFALLEGTSTAKVVVLAGEDADEPPGDEDGDDLLPLHDITLRPADRTPPAPRRPLEESGPDADVDEPGSTDEEEDADDDEDELDEVASVVDRAYESRSAR